MAKADRYLTPRTSARWPRASHNCSLRAISGLTGQVDRMKKTRCNKTASCTGILASTGASIYVGRWKRELFERQARSGEEYKRYLPEGDGGDRKRTGLPTTALA